MRLIVGGSHLSRRHGLTVSEIEKDGWPIAARVPFLKMGDDSVAFGRSCGLAVSAFARLFADSKPQLVVVSGDRVELLPIMTAAVLTHTAVAHVGGGDITEGAIDDQVRHAVTKVAHLHFPSTERSAERVLQMGEEPWRVHMAGNLAQDHFTRGKFASRGELAAVLGFAPDRRTLLVTFHPATMELADVPRQATELIRALNGHDGQIVISAPAPDPGAEAIRRAAHAVMKGRANAVFVESLGAYHYYGLMRAVGAMVGNSSSGLNEAPLVPLPVVNIGIRQQGRERGRNVIDVPAEASCIAEGIRVALSRQFRASLTNGSAQVPDGPVALRVIDVIASLASDSRLLMKRFAVWPPKAGGL